MRPGRPAASPSTSASYVEGTPRWCSTPSAVEALPCGSRSITSTRCPSWASAAATFTVVVVLPTPPFWLATTMTRVASGRGIGGPMRGLLPGPHRVLGHPGQRGAVVVERVDAREVAAVDTRSARSRRWGESGGGRGRASEDVGVGSMFHVKPRSSPRLSD